MLILETRFLKIELIGSQTLTPPLVGPATQDSNYSFIIHGGKRPQLHVPALWHVLRFVMSSWVLH